MKTCLVYNVISQTISLFWTDPLKKKINQGWVFCQIIAFPQDLFNFNDVIMCLITRTGF